MNKNARLIAISAALTLAFGTSTAWAAKIGVSMSQFDDNFLTVLRGGMQKHAESLGDVQLQFEDAQKDVGRQLNQMQNFISAKLDAIIANAEAAQDAPDATTAPQTTDAELEADVAACEAEWAKNAATAQAKPRTRDNSKQAEVIRMLQRPEGATIGQICTATGWQAHTVRGTFAGAFKKKLGLNIVSDKPQGGERIYRIA